MQCRRVFLDETVDTWTDHGPASEKDRADQNVQKLVGLNGQIEEPEQAGREHEQASDRQQRVPSHEGNISETLPAEARRRLLVCAGSITIDFSSW